MRLYILICALLFHEGLTAKSLYDSNDFVEELTEESKELLSSPDKIWIVEFYAHWCGHCIRYAPFWKKIASLFQTWKDSIVIASYNCAEYDCSSYQIPGTPTMKVFRPYNGSNNNGYEISSHKRLVLHDIFDAIKEVRNKEIANPSKYPDLAPFRGYSLQELSNEADRSVLLFKELPELDWSERIVIEYSHDPNIQFKIIDSRKRELSREFNLTSRPAVVLVNWRDRKEDNIFYVDLSSYTSTFDQVSAFIKKHLFNTDDILENDLSKHMVVVKKNTEKRYRVSVQLNNHNFHDSIQNLDKDIDYSQYDIQNTKNYVYPAKKRYTRSTKNNNTSIDFGIERSSMQKVPPFLSGILKKDKRNELFDFIATQLKAMKTKAGIVCLYVNDDGSIEVVKRHEQGLGYVIRSESNMKGRDNLRNHTELGNDQINTELIDGEDRWVKPNLKSKDGLIKDPLKPKGIDTGTNDLLDNKNIRHANSDGSNSINTNRSELSLYNPNIGAFITGLSGLHSPLYMGKFGNGKGVGNIIRGDTSGQLNENANLNGKHASIDINNGKLNRINGRISSKMSNSGSIDPLTNLLIRGGILLIGSDGSIKMSNQRVSDPKNLKKLNARLNGMLNDVNISRAGLNRLGRIGSASYNGPQVHSHLGGLHVGLNGNGGQGAMSGHGSLSLQHNINNDNGKLNVKHGAINGNPLMSNINTVKQVVGRNSPLKISGGTKVRFPTLGNIINGIKGKVSINNQGQEKFNEGLNRLGRIGSASYNGPQVHSHLGGLHVGLNGNGGQGAMSGYGSLGLQHNINNDNGKLNIKRGAINGNPLMSNINNVKQVVRGDSPLKISGGAKIQFPRLRNIINGFKGKVSINNQRQEKFNEGLNRLGRIGSASYNGSLGHPHLGRLHVGLNGNGDQGAMSGHGSLGLQHSINIDNGKLNVKHGAINGNPLMSSINNVKQVVGGDSPLKISGGRMFWFPTLGKIINGLTGKVSINKQGQEKFDEGLNRLGSIISASDNRSLGHSHSGGHNFGLNGNGDQGAMSGHGFLGLQHNINNDNGKLNIKRGAINGNPLMSNINNVKQVVRGDSPLKISGGTKVRFPRIRNIIDSNGTGNNTLILWSSIGNNDSYPVPLPIKSGRKKGRSLGNIGFNMGPVHASSIHIHQQNGHSTDTMVFNGNEYKFKPFPEVISKSININRNRNGTISNKASGKNEQKNNFFTERYSPNNIYHETVERSSEPYLMYDTKLSSKENNGVDQWRTQESHLDGIRRGNLFYKLGVVRGSSGQKTQRERTEENQLLVKDQEQLMNTSGVNQSPNNITDDLISIPSGPDSLYEYVNKDNLTNSVEGLNLSGYSERKYYSHDLPINFKGSKSISKYIDLIQILDEKNGLTQSDIDKKKICEKYLKDYKIESSLTEEKDSNEELVSDSSNNPDIVYEGDLEKTIKYMLTVEVPMYSKMQEGKFAALRFFLSTLIKYLPLRIEILRTILELRNWVDERPNFNKTDYEIKLQELEEKYDPFKRTPSEWKGCKGSSPYFRGYPCGVWTLFHVLSVSSFIHGDPMLTSDVSSSTVAMAILEYVKNFFSCRHCAKNFMKKVDNIGHLPSNPSDVILWIWKIHNMANEKLRGDSTEDPEHPKIIWPSERNCPVCRSSKGSLEALGEIWSTKDLLNYVINVYKEESIDRLSGTLASNKQDNDDEEEEDKLVTDILDGNLRDKEKLIKRLRKYCSKLT